MRVHGSLRTRHRNPLNETAEPKCRWSLQRRLALARRHSKSQAGPQASAGCFPRSRWAIRQAANLSMVMIITAVATVDTEAERGVREKLWQLADQAVQQRCS